MAKLAPSLLQGPGPNTLRAGGLGRGYNIDCGLKIELKLLYFLRLTAFAVRLQNNGSATSWLNRSIILRTPRLSIMLRLRTPLHPHESGNFIDDWPWFVVPGDKLGQCMHTSYLASTIWAECNLRASDFLSEHDETDFSESRRRHGIPQHKCPLLQGCPCIKLTPASSRGSSKPHSLFSESFWSIKARDLVPRIVRRGKGPQLLRPAFNVGH